MPMTPEEKKAELLDKVCAHAREKLPDDAAALVEPFVREYYANLAPEDLLSRNVLDLYGAALAHWTFARHRTPGRAKLRVYNPRYDEHGWQSTHTIVEIVNDNMTFLVDSVSAELNRRGLTLHLIIHPIFAVERDADGNLLRMQPPGEGTEALPRESVMHVEIDRFTAASSLEEIERSLKSVLADVRRAVEDWPAMRERLQAIIDEFEQRPPPVDEAERAEVTAFLRWIEDNHFVFLGYREYELVRDDGDDHLRVVPDSGLGVMRDAAPHPFSRTFDRLPPAARRFMRARHPLILTKANIRSTVHRSSYMDYLGVKRFDDDGNVLGERRFFGLYASSVYTRSPRDIPFLRRKVFQVLERENLDPRSHDGRQLLNILETYPRDELIHASVEQLRENARGILQLQERQRIRLFVRRDPYGCFFSCLLYVPRERYDTELRERMQDVLIDAFEGSGADYSALVGESPLARLHYVIHTDPHSEPDYDVHEIEARLTEATRSWTDDLRDALEDEYGEELGNRLFRTYGEAFPAGYREDLPARMAVFDIAQMERLTGPDTLGMNLYRPLEAERDVLHFRLFRLNAPIYLSDALPMLENMGLKVIGERPYEARRDGDGCVWIHDFRMQYAGEEIDLDRIRGPFQEAFLRLWRGHIENDGFNRLVLGAGLGWRDVVILRALAKYMRQIGVTFSQNYIEDALSAHPNIAHLLCRLFAARFDPLRQEDAQEREADLATEIEHALDQVASLDEDRILRNFLHLITAALRTNHYQTDENGEHRPYLSIKLDPTRVPEMPLPRPMFEIWVYSPRTEGVHLRGGPVARGGLRWSDRREDFRTEVLGLMKAQMVKNAVIVPVGAKGGFIVKQPPIGGDREAVMREGIACYRAFISGLLDVTDNIVGGQVVPPVNVVRHDGDDPYLVVAADKGTATFSDIANGIAQEYGFWLDDAFASGGSAGYDHKKMGITARGAWESVKRHFRELGLDTQSQDFTVVGVGDMSGDVFGNGMLLSRHIRLIAAFDHRHIFLDPDPDPAASFAERERLFALPRSSWADYNPDLISPGGGVFPRTAKSIRLSPEARRALAIDIDTATPLELIRAILRAPVDLLWNGGIGTYVKASTERNAEVGDKANDPVRISADELRCRVVGEGGNLGFTQLGRIEYAKNGGRINTDAIDNSAGVDTSDHEVNIKILLNGVIADGDLTRKQRDELLVRMTDEVAGLVLRSNYLQTQAISMMEARAPLLLDEHARLIRDLGRAGKLDREIEFLPSDEEIAERHATQAGLTRPELAVLLAYAKIDLYRELTESDLSEDPHLSLELERYFPAILAERFGAQMRGHRLRREIIATHVANSMVNRASATFVHRLAEQTGAAGADIARAYAIAREVFDMRATWESIEALDNRVPAEAQITMLVDTTRLIEGATLWLLRNRRRPLDIAAAVGDYAPGVGAMIRALPRLVLADGEAHGERRAQLVQTGVPEDLATRVAGLTMLSSALDIVEVARAAGLPVENVAAVYFTLGTRLELHWLRAGISALPGDNHWQALAKVALHDDLSLQQRALTADALRLDGRADDPDPLVSAWAEENRDTVEHWQRFLADLRASGGPDLAILSVALREVRSLARTGAAPVAGEAPAPEERVRLAGE